MFLQKEPKLDEEQEELLELLDYNSSSRLNITQLYY